MKIKEICIHYPQIESADIATYLDETFPEPALRFGDAGKEAAASEAIAGIFPALAKLNKVSNFGIELVIVESSQLCLFQNTESPQELKDGLWNELKKADHYLDAECTSDFLLGDKVTSNTQNDNHDHLHLQ